MKTRYLNIGDNDWGVLLCYDYSAIDQDQIWAILKAFGLSDEKAEIALDTLSYQNTGMTLTSFPDMMTVMFIGRATSDEEWFNTLIHELRHTVDHIDDFYQVSLDSEPSAYLQGEIGRQLFPIIIQKLCHK